MMILFSAFMEKHSFRSPLARASFSFGFRNPLNAGACARDGTQGQLRRRSVASDGPREGRAKRARPRDGKPPASVIPRKVFAIPPAEFTVR
jgi:hypothetical protein